MDSMLMAFIDSVKHSVDELNKVTTKLKKEVKNVDLSIQNLEEVIKRANISNDKYSNRMLWLTIVIAVLTFVMTVAVGYQILS